MYVVQCMFVCMYAHMYLYVYLYAHTDTLAKNVSPLSNSAMRNTLASISRPMWRGQPANRNWQRRGLSAGCTFVLEACPVLSVRRPCSCLRDGFQQYENVGTSDRSKILHAWIRLLPTRERSGACGFDRAPPLAQD